MSTVTQDMMADGLNIQVVGVSGSGATAAALTSQRIKFLVINTPNTTISTLTDELDRNLLTVLGFSSTFQWQTGMIVRAPQGLTIKAVTIAAGTAVAYTD
jgi:hypothetical protein